MTMSKYYYAEGAVHHDHHKEMTVNVSGKADIAALMKAFMAEDIEDVEELFPDATPEEAGLPDILCTTEAKDLFTKLHAAGIVDDAWQPMGLSNAEKGTLVEYIDKKLDIRNKWKFFGVLWKIDAQTLRTAKARGLDQEKTWHFRNKLEAL